MANLLNLAEVAASLRLSKLEVCRLLGENRFTEPRRLSRARIFCAEVDIKAWLDGGANA
jgi:hypothetical protein